MKKHNASLSYVLNMTRNDQIPEGMLDVTTLDDFNARNIICLLKDSNDFNQDQRALYQIRCNTFHGEKTPYGPNDTDAKVVKAAYFVLDSILQTCRKDWYAPKEYFRTRIFSLMDKIDSLNKAELIDVNILEVLE